MPSPRAAHGAARLGRQVFVFGGRHDTQRLNDLYVLNMSDCVWTQWVFSFFTVCHKTFLLYLFRLLWLCTTCLCFNNRWQIYATVNLEQSVWMFCWILLFILQWSSGNMPYCTTSRDWIPLWAVMCSLQKPLQYIQHLAQAAHPHCSAWVDIAFHPL